MVNGWLITMLWFSPSEMCRHTGLRLVCFACLFLSVNPSSQTAEADGKWADACSTGRIFEKYSNNGSLSLEGLDRVLKMVESTCTSYWKEKRTTPHDDGVPTEPKSHSAKGELCCTLSSKVFDVYQC